MTKVDIINAVSEMTTEITKKDITTITDAIFETIMNEVAGGEEVKIAGFGVFGKKIREAHTGRNPKTNESVEVEEKTYPTFRSLKEFKEAVNNG